MYKVIKKFADLQDNNFIYDIGDIYPREGVEPTEDRYVELASNSNRQGVPLIEKCEISVDEMTVPQLKKYAAENNIDLAKASKKEEILAKIKEAETAEN